MKKDLQGLNPNKNRLIIPPYEPPTFTASDMVDFSDWIDNNMTKICVQDNRAYTKRALLDTYLKSKSQTP